MKQFHCLTYSTSVFLLQNSEYKYCTLKSLYNSYSDNIVYTLNNTQEEIDISNENIYVDNNGEWTKALKIIRHKRNPESPMVYIRSTNGYGLSLQDNHPIAIKLDNNYIFKKPKDVNIKRDKFCISNANIWQEDKHNPFIDGYLLGAFLGDGYVQPGKIYKDHRIYSCITFVAFKDVYENKIRNKCIDILTKDGFNPKVTDIRINIYSANLAKKLNKECDKHAWNKHLPSDFIYYTDETLCKILCGVIDTDGYIETIKDYKYIRIEMVSEALINQLALICKKFNLKHGIRVSNLNSPSGKKYNHKHQSYILSIYVSPDKLDIFKESIKCKLLNTREVQKRNHIYDETVNYYKPIFFNDDEDYVYDLETEAHQFSANGILIHNTGGAAEILYISKEAPQMVPYITQENNNLIAKKDIKITVYNYEQETTDTVTAKEFTIEDSDGEIVKVNFRKDIVFNTLIATTTDLNSDGDTGTLQYQEGDTIGEISATATDTSSAVLVMQKVLNHASDYENPDDMVLELYSIFGQAIPLIFFEVLVSQIIRDPDKLYYPYRYSNMTKPPKFLGIKQVPGQESVKRGIMFERILDVITNSILQGDNANKDPRVTSALENLFDL